jgi:lia operon protein LiaG
MDKKLNQINIAIWGIIAVFLTILLVYGIASGKGKGGGFLMFNFKNTKASVQKEENISLDKCNNITLDFSSYDVVISSTDEENLKVIQRSNMELNEEEKFSFSKDDTTIAIEKGKSKNMFKLFNFGSYNNQIELFIPKKYNKSLEVKTSSGNIEVKGDITLDKVNVSQTSGDFQGRKSITANEVNLKASSGNIEAETFIAKAYKIRVTSGDVDIKSLSGSGEVEASSGNINISYKDIGEELNARATSGNIELNIPVDISFEFYGKCSSGDIDTSFDVGYRSKKKNEATAKIGNSPYKKINVTASSGNIDVYQK